MLLQALLTGSCTMLTACQKSIVEVPQNPFWFALQRKAGAVVLGRQTVSGELLAGGIKGELTGLDCACIAAQALAFEHCCVLLLLLCALCCKGHGVSTACNASLPET